MPAADPVLQRLFDRHFNADRTGIAQEHLFKAARRQLYQQLAELNRRFMRQAAEHHVRHLVELGLGSGIQHRMTITVDRTPPRRHAVDQRSAVFQHDAYALGMAHRIHRQRILHRGIGVPEVVSVEIEVGHAGGGWWLAEKSGKYTQQWHHSRESVL